MRRRLTMILAGLAALAALALGGAAIANATGVVGDGQQLSSSEADRAHAAALHATGGGTVLESEREGGAIEVEVRKPDGTVVEVHLDSSYRVVGVGGDEEPDDDDGSEQEDAGEN